MKRLRFLLVLFAFVVAVGVWMRADQFKIVYLSTSSIKIGDKDYALGEVFSSDEPIHWKNDKQIIKVRSMSDGQQYILRRDSYRASKTWSIDDYYIKTRPSSVIGSTKGPNNAAKGNIRGNINGNIKEKNREDSIPPDSTQVDKNTIAE